MRIKIKIYKSTPGEYPFSPFVQIVLEYWASDKEGFTCLSPQCTTERELRFYAERIKSEVDAEVLRVIKQKLLPK